MLGKERGRAAQDAVVEIVAQIGHHPEAGVIHQVRSHVVEDSLEHGSAHERKSHHRPGIVKMRGNQILQEQRSIRARQNKQLDRPALRGGIQHTVKDRTDQQQAKRIQQSHHRHKKHGGQELPKVGEQVTQKPRQLAGRIFQDLSLGRARR